MTLTVNASREQTELFQGKVVNVMDPPFGAKGDGSSDDSAAIQAAVDSRAAGVFFPRPSVCYLLGSTVTVSNPDQTLIGHGHGSLLKPSASSFNLLTLARNAHRIRFQNLAFIGAAIDDATIQFGIFSDASPNDCEVYGCFFGSSRDTGPSLNDGIKINRGARWSVHDNAFSYLQGVVSGTGYGVLCGATRGLIAHNNHFIGDESHGRHAVYLSSGCTSCDVYNNVVDGFFSTAFPIYSKRGQAPAIANKIHANIVKGGGSRSNVSAAALSILGGSSRNIIANNTVDGFAGRGIFVSELGSGAPSEENVIDGNSLSNLLEQGILIEGAEDTEVVNNRINNCGVARPAIQIQKSGSVPSQNTRVVGNSAHGSSIRCGLSIQQAVNTGTVAIGNDFSEGTVGKMILVEPETPLVAQNNNVGLPKFSRNMGDADMTCTVSATPENVRYASALTADRRVTLSTTNAYSGAKFRIIRTGLGAFSLDVGGLRTIPPSTAGFVDVEYTGPAKGWTLTGYGAL